MTAKSEELREQIAKRIFTRSAPADYFWGMTGTLADEACRREEQYSFVDADYLLSLIFAPFGGQSNFEAVLEKLEQTRGKCKECNGLGGFSGWPQITAGRCKLCHGSGKVVQIERIVVLDEDQTPHSLEGTFDWSANSIESLKSGKLQE